MRPCAFLAAGPVRRTDGGLGEAVYARRMSAEQLSALDSTFLELEQADGSAHMHIGAVLVFDPIPGRGAPTREQVLRRLGRRLPMLPRFRQKLSEPSVSGLRRPHWVDDPGFDLKAHVGRAALPAPGGDAELLEWAGGFYSQRLDRRLPLWEFVFVEGLEDGRWALATKLHHSLADGVGSLEMTTLFRDGVPATSGPPPVRAHDHPPAVAQLLRAGFDVLRHPRHTAGQAEALAQLIVREELIAAPPCSLNVPIGEHRRLAVARTTLAEVAAIRRAFGGTVNDVVLTAVTSGLRDVLVARGEEPPKAGLRAMVPVNLRTEDDGELGNRVLSRFVALPVDEAELLQRHRRVVAAGRGAKHGHQPVGGATLISLAEHLPPVLHLPLAQSVFGTRLFNVTVTNVPGPPGATRTFKARLADIVPVVPLAAEHAVGVAVISHAGRLTFCVNADRDTVPDASLVAAGITQALEQLGAAVAAEVPASAAPGGTGSGQ